MRAALQVYSRDFDADYFKLPTTHQLRIQAAIDRLGQNLDTHPHVRLQGMNACRLRVGDYRVVYQFDLTRGVLQLLAVGHRREIYR